MSAQDTALPSELHDAISERAAEFFERRRFGAWGDADQIELEAWIAESYLHRAAWLRVEGIGARADRLAAIRALDLRQRGSKSGRGLLRKRFVLPLLVAASVALLTAPGMRLANYLMQPPVHSFSTDVGGRTLLRFADGTEFELDTDTAVHYLMSTTERTVWLDRGEAWFHVAHNVANPFTVVVGTHRVTDLGTEFLVRRGANLMEVALLNGRASLATEGAQTATLRPGDEAIATPASVSVTRKSPQELSDELAWRRGVLVFRDATLADAVREVNRYNTTKLVIGDSSIADLKFTGEIRNDDLGDFLYLARSVMKLRVDREGRNILLSRAAAKRTKAARGL